MNAACLKCNLITLNQHKWLARGKYAEQFKIESNPANAKFVAHPYVQGKCGDGVNCFSLINGAKKCVPERSTMLGYDASGNLVKTKVRHLGSF